MGIVAMLPVIPITLLLLLIPMEASAHISTSPAWQTEWDFAPWLLWMMLCSAGVYVTGYLRLLKASGGRYPMVQGWAFAGGWLALVVALISPLDALGNWLFSAHMLQHEIMMIIAAPLLVMSRPLSIWSWAVPKQARKKIGSITGHAWIKRPWQMMTYPLGAWAIHAVALWGWHLPGLFDAALQDNAIHITQHVSFMFSALLFWWSVLGNDRRSAKRGWAMLSLFSTMLHTAALGVLLTLASKPWYTYQQTTLFGLSALEDQQLGGLIMWVPAGLVYLVAGLWLLGSWLQLRESTLNDRVAAINVDARS